jgi:hypothetical protein
MYVAIYAVFLINGIINVCKSKIDGNDKGVVKKKKERNKNKKKKK